jgi:hypothetical protein
LIGEQGEPHPETAPLAQDRINQVAISMFGAAICTEYFHNNVARFYGAMNRVAVSIASRLIQ